MKNVFLKKEARIRSLVDKFEVEVRYIPGLTEDSDLYEAVFEKYGFNLNCFGRTKDAAIDSLKNLIIGEILYRLDHNQM
jgi:hypothetical protein